MFLTYYQVAPVMFFYTATWTIIVPGNLAYYSDCKLIDLHYFFFFFPLWFSY